MVAALGLDSGSLAWRCENNPESSNPKADTTPWRHMASPTNQPNPSQPSILIIVEYAIAEHAIEMTRRIAPQIAPARPHRNLRFNAKAAAIPRQNPSGRATPWGESSPTGKSLSQGTTNQTIDRIGAVKTPKNNPLSMLAAFRFTGI